MRTRLILKIVFKLHFLLIGFGTLYAQQTDIPILKESLLTANSDTLKIDIYSQLILSYATINIDSSLYFWEKAIGLAEELEDIERIRNVNFNGFYTLFDQGKYYEAKIIGERGLKNGKKLNNDLLIGKCYMMLANLYYNLSDLGEYYKALITGIEYAEQAGDSKTIAAGYSGLSAFYYEKEEYKKSSEKIRKAMEIYKEIRDSSNLGLLHQNMAHFLIEKEQYDSALYYSNLSLAHLRNTNQPYYEIAMGRKAEALFFMGREQKSLDILKEAIFLATKKNQKHNLVLLNYRKAKFLAAQKKYNEAIIVAKKGVDISNEIGYKGSLPKLFSLLINCNKSISNTEKALYWAEEKIKIDSVFYQKEKASKTAKLEANYALQKQESVKQVLLLENKIQKILFGILLSLGLILSALGYSYLKRKQRKQFLEFRETVAADLHDDIGSDLNSLSRMAKELKNPNSSLTISERIDLLVKKTNTSIKNVVDVVWSIDNSKLEVGQLIEKMESHLDAVKAANPNVKINLVKQNLNERKSLTTKQKHHLLMVFKEAINNIQQHTNSSDINIVIENIGGGLRLEVINLFDSKKYTHDSTGRGLVNIRRRIMELDGQVEFKEEKNKFEVKVELKKI